MNLERKEMYVVTIHILDSCARFSTLLQVAESAQGEQTKTALRKMENCKGAKDPVARKLPLVEL